MLELFGGGGTHGDAHTHLLDTERVFVFKSGRKRNRRGNSGGVGAVTSTMAAAHSCNGVCVLLF